MRFGDCVTHERGRRHVSMSANSVIMWRMRQSDRSKILNQHSGILFLVFNYRDENTFLEFDLENWRKYHSRHESCFLGKNYMY